MREGGKPHPLKVSYFESKYSSRRFSKKTNGQRLTLLGNNSSSQKKQISLFVFLENLRLDKLLSKLTDL